MKPSGILLFLLFFTITTPYSTYAQRMYYGNFSETVAQYNKLREQGKGLYMQRMGIGVGLYFIRNDVEISVDNPDGTGTLSAKTKVSSKWAISGSGDFSFPLSYYGEKANLAICAGFTFAGASMKIDSVAISDNRVINDEYSMIMFGIPVSLDYKTGGEAILNKSYKSLFTIGMGLQPTLFTSEYPRRGGGGGNIITIRGEPVFKVVPFVKAEFGFHAGMAFKLRGVAYIGDAKYVDSQNDYGVHVKAKGSCGYMFSLIFMPFSWDWESDY